MNEGNEALQLLIQAKFAGSMADTSVYMNLVIQTGAVLIGGIVLWRVSARYHKKKAAQRERNSYFETTYSRNWKRK